MPMSPPPERAVWNSYPSPTVLPASFQDMFRSSTSRSGRVEKAVDVSSRSVWLSARSNSSAW